MSRPTTCATTRTPPTTGSSRPSAPRSAAPTSPPSSARRWCAARRWSTASGKWADEGRQDLHDRRQRRPGLRSHGHRPGVRVLAVPAGRDRLRRGARADRLHGRRCGTGWTRSAASPATPTRAWSRTRRTTTRRAPSSVSPATATRSWPDLLKYPGINNSRSFVPKDIPMRFDARAMPDIDRWVRHHARPDDVRQRPVRPVEFGALRGRQGTPGTPTSSRCPAATTARTSRS